MNPHPYSRTAASTKSGGIDASDSMPSLILPRTAASTQPEGLDATVSILPLACLHLIQDATHLRNPSSFFQAHPNTTPSFFYEMRVSLKIVLPKETPVTDNVRNDAAASIPVYHIMFS